MCSLPQGTFTLAQYPPKADHLPSINYDRYQTLNSVYEYGAIEVSETGTIIPRRPPRPEILKFIGDLGLKKALWNGRNGIRGMAFEEFEAAETAADRAPPTATEVARLRGMYKQLMPALPSNEHESLPSGKSIASEVRGKYAQRLLLCGQGRRSVPQKLMSERDMDRTEFVRHATDQGTTSVPKSAESICRRVSVPTKRLSVITEVSSSDDSAIKRLAMLERVFGHVPSGASCLNTSSLAFLIYSEDAEQLAGLRQTSFKRYMQILRLYADAKSGLGHLQALEGTLKSIIGNLREAMQAVSSHAQLDENGMYVVPISPSYRLRYVKTLRTKADELLADVIRFCPFTGIGYPKATTGRFGRSCRNPPQPDIAQHRVTCCGYSTYSRTLSLLPEFTKLMQLHRFRVKRQISALYEHAAAAYEEVNAVYDFQLALTRRTLADLRKAAAEVASLEDQLRRVRETLLLEC